MTSEHSGPSLPWYRVPTVWLALGGPALVVVASFVTLGYAVRGADTPVHESTVSQSEALTPATQARNHAATPKR